MFSRELQQSKLLFRSQYNVFNLILGKGLSSYKAASFGPSRADKSKSLDATDAAFRIFGRAERDWDRRAKAARPAPRPLPNPHPGAAPSAASSPSAPPMPTSSTPRRGN